MNRILIFLLMSATIQGHNGMKISKIIDLTHTLTSETPSWDGMCGFNLVTTQDHHQCSAQTKYKQQSLQLKKTGIGTHIDAPIHCFPNAASVAELSLENLITKAYVINVSTKADLNYKISVDDIIEFERLHGTIEKNSLVIVHTGWSKRWHNSKEYRNENEHGIMKFPSFSAQAAQLLIDRNVAGIAIDTLSPDCPGSNDPVHRIMLSNNKYMIENIANADQLPPVGAYIIALPLKIESTEAPLRIIGLTFENQ